MVADEVPYSPVEGEIEDRPVSKRKLWFKGLLTFAAFAFGFIIGAFIVFFLTKESAKYPELTTAPEELRDQGTSCRVSVVGTGWAGVYLAFRLVVDTATVAPSDLCIFEANEKRMGGRAYSLETEEDGVLDVGAALYESTQPLISSLLENRLQLPSGCHECHRNATSRILVDAQGNPAGFGLGIQEMARLLQEKGARPVIFGHRLVKLEPQDGASVRLIFSNGDAYTSEKVLLNLPASSFNNMDPGSLVYQVGLDVLDLYDLPTSKDMAKAYIYYEDAWWFTKLNLSHGAFIDRQYPPLRGSYGDRGVKCDEEGCRGFLNVLLSQNKVEVDYYRNFQKNMLDPLVTLTPTSNSDLLRDIHNSLMKIHEEALRNAGYETVMIDAPRLGYLGIWSETEFQRGYPGTHVIPCERAKEVEERMKKPLSGHEIYVANEGWTTQRTAEGALQMAEDLLQDHFGLPPPAWLEPPV